MPFLPGLLGGQVDHVVVVGKIDHVRLGRGHLGQNGGEVRILGGVGFLADDLAAASREGLLKVLGQALYVVVRLVQHDESRLGLQGIEGELGAYRALERIDEARPINVVFHLAVFGYGDGRIGGAVLI